MTEAEVQEGILKIPDAAKKTLWLKRTIEGIEDQDTSYALSRYIGKGRQLAEVGPTHLCNYWNGIVNFGLSMNSMFPHDLKS